MDIEIRTEDARFVLDVVGESDPWFVQGVSASLFASRFRNFVVARCRSQGLNLSADELDLIEAWFAAPANPQRSASAPNYGPGQAQPAAQQPKQQAAAPQEYQQPQAPAQGANSEQRAERWWGEDDRRPPRSGMGGSDEFPRIIRTRLRG